MQEHDFRNSFSKRVGFVCLLLFSLSIIIVVKQGVLQMSDCSDTCAPTSADQQATTVGQQAEAVVEQPVRGTIYDRNDQPLATSTMYQCIAIAPMYVKYPHEVAVHLGEILHMDAAALEQRIRTEKKFFYLKRDGAAAECEEIRRIGHQYFQSIERRLREDKNAPIHVFAGVYTGSETLGERYNLALPYARHLLGSVRKSDSQGMNGIEAIYNKELSGSAGLAFRTIDGGSCPPVAKLETLKATVPGANVRLTIDANIQHIAGEALRKAINGDYLKYGKKVERQHAKGGTCIVMDAKSGEVLAMATTATRTRTQSGTSSSAEKKQRPCALGDAYEPGGVFNTFTAAAALQNGAQPSTVYSCPRSMEVDGCTIGGPDDGLFTSGSETLSDIVKFSFNTGMSKVALSLGKEKLAKTLDDFGFGHETGIGWPGEDVGIIGDYRNWSKLDLCTRSLGQGCAVTPLQLVSAMQAVANSGVRMQPRLVKSIVDNDGNILKEFPAKELNRPISPQTANELKEMLCTVLDDDGVNYAGAGAPGAIPGYRAAGKTGTAQVADPVYGGYVEGRYNASFLGFAPADNPRVVVLVKIEDPEPIYFSGMVAGPIWRYVCERVLPYMGVAPTPGYEQAVGCTSALEKCPPLTVYKRERK